MTWRTITRNGQTYLVPTDQAGTAPTGINERIAVLLAALLVGAEAKPNGFQMQSGACAPTRPRPVARLVALPPCDAGAGAYSSQPTPQPDTPPRQGE